MTFKSVFTRNPDRAKQEVNHYSRYNLARMLGLVIKNWGNEAEQKTLFPFNDIDPLQKRPFDTNLCMFNLPSLV